MQRNAKISLCALLLISLLTIFFHADAKLNTQSAFGEQPNRYFLPLFFNQSGTLASPSYYMTTLDYGFIYNLGCELGKSDLKQDGAQDNVAVLAFGYPRCFDSGGFGANLFGFGPATLDDIGTAVKHFAAGYYICSGEDMDSNLVIGVGTSNYLGGTEPCQTESKANAHGKAWSGMVREINQWLVSQGIFHQVQAFGASDMELDWNSPEWSRAWLAGFEQVSGNFLLHFGDAAGCPYEDNPTWACGTPAYPHWTEEDVWYIAYGAPSALPLPLIYLTNGVHAKQWAHLSQYSVTQHGYRMDFTGVFTQWLACQQFGNCDGIDNTPDQAYQQLFSELGKSPTTAQNLHWKTDIRWILQSELAAVGGTSAAANEGSDTHPLQSRSEAFDSALDETFLSTTLASSLAFKQNTYQTMAEMASLSRANPAPKGDHLFIPTGRSVDLPFESGIIPNGEIPGRPYGVEITTVWQAPTENGYLQIAAGSSPSNAYQGALYIIQTVLDYSSFQSKVILAPEECGLLTITADDDHSLFIESINGCRLIFDLRDWVLTFSSD
jgi:hypothetical protein